MVFNRPTLYTHPAISAHISCLWPSPRRVAHPSFFCLVGVFVVTTKIPTLAERRLERGTRKQLSVASCQLPVKTTADPSTSLGCARDDKRQLSVASSQLKKPNPQPGGRHNRSPASGETQCVPLWEIVVTLVLRNAFSPRPCCDPQNRMGSAGVSLQRCECPPALCSRDSEPACGPQQRSLRTSDPTNSHPSQRRAEESRSLDGPRSNTPASTNPVLPGDPVCARGRSG